MLAVVGALLGCPGPPPPPEEPPVDPFVDPRVTPLAGSEGACVRNLVAGGRSLYWLDACTGHLEGLLAAGGTRQRVTGLRYQELQNDLVSDGAALYWTDYPQSQLPTVRRLSLSGGLPQTLYSVQGFLQDLCVSGDRLVWWIPSASGLDERWTVWSAPTDGSAPPTQVARIFRPLSRMTCDGAHVYWAQEAAFDTLAHLQSMPIDGGAPVEVASMPKSQGALRAAPDGTLAILQSRNESNVDLYRMGPGDAKPSMLGTFHIGASLFIDNRGIVVADDLRVIHFDAAGGSPTVLHSVPPGGFPHVTADAEAVSWSGERGLFRVPRP
jgi:hypothetical protein